MRSEARYAGLKSVLLSQFGLRTSWIDVRGLWPRSCPAELFLTMYGPVETTCVLYVDGFFASNVFAYSCGTGTVIGMTSAAATPTPAGFDSLITSVFGSGQVMPEIDLKEPGLVGAPAMSVKYVVYSFATFAVNARSNAYLTSLHCTSRLTGGENLMPLFIFTVTVLLSDEICGGPSATSGCGSLDPGLKL